MRPPLIAVVAGAAVAATLTVAAVAATPPRATAAAASAAVTLKDISFKPSTVTIRHGQSVTWTWRDGTTSHNVTSQGKQRFKSASTRQTGTYTVKFTQPGTYRYVCTIHFGMNGKVVVR